MGSCDLCSEAGQDRLPTLAGDHDVQTVRIDEARGDVTQIRFAHQQPSTALSADEAARFR